MKNIIIKTATPLSLVVLLTMGMTMESQANEGSELFLSSDYGETLALNYGVRRKPPYIRSNMNRKRNYQKMESVEMSALEINEGAAVIIPSLVTGKITRGGHPDRAKRYGNR